MIDWATGSGDPRKPLSLLAGLASNYPSDPLPFECVDPAYQRQ
jgi:hypothetical protein